MKRRKIVVVAFVVVLLNGISILSSSANTPPEISNVRASQREGTKLIDIYYDVYDADNDPLIVRVRISHNGGGDYGIAKTLTGDLGADVTPGRNKHVVWDAGTDWDGEYSDQAVVKIGATDRKGCPGMEFSDEIRPGGFLMGYDELSSEGSGPSKRVVIPWNYWLGKYEVTVAQYCEFLNWALAAGYVSRNTSGKFITTSSAPYSDICPSGSDVSCSGLGWNNTECVLQVTPGEENKPVVVNWYGAMAFSRFYGYDLPTEAEWEMAARGPDHLDRGEHQVCPWGDSDPAEYANYSHTSSRMNDGTYRYYLKLSNVGSLSATPNNLYDILGNVGEWTRTKWSENVTLYSSPESLTNEANTVRVFSNRTLRGDAGGGGLYWSSTINRRESLHPGTSNYWLGEKRDNLCCGFRVCRRPPNIMDEGITEPGSGGSVNPVTPDGGLRSTGVLTFEDWAPKDNVGSRYVTSNGYTWGIGTTWKVVDDSRWAASGSKCIYGCTTGSGSGNDIYLTWEFKLPVVPGNVKEVRMKVGNFDGNNCVIHLHSSVTGNSYTSVSKQIYGASGYQDVVFIPSISGSYNYITGTGLYIDDIEVIYEVSE